MGFGRDDKLCWEGEAATSNKGNGSTADGLGTR